ncbi:MAG TPA: glycosyltransferase family 4 protein [Geminicoccaceae bacterium]|nr:glycosyltransferase family 4 protein [Geminicoccaceae bacterium]
MLVWLVNPFDPLPGEEEQPRRYAYLAAQLRAAGHRVVWWSSSFSHRFKRPVDAAAVQRAAQARDIAVRLIATPPYGRNLSLRRLWNHRVLARRFQAAAVLADRPDLIVVSSPPLELAATATKLGRDWGVPTVVDVQDQWPDNFDQVVPPALRPLARAGLRPLYRLERAAYRDASAIVGVARGYVERGLAVGGPKQRHAVFHLGIDIGELRQAMARGESRYAARWARRPDEVRFLYSGSFTASYDVLTIVRTAKAVQARHGDRVRFVLTGTGALAAEVEAIVQREALGNVALPGFLDFAEYAYLLSQCDAGFNASFPDTLIYFPNKIFFYLAAGMAVLNTIPGECAELVAGTGCGLGYVAGDTQSCQAAISRLVERPDERRAMQAAARAVAAARFGRDTVYEAFVRFLEDVVASGR